jgi:hypothetical protein
VSVNPRATLGVVSPGERRLQRDRVVRGFCC